MRFFILLLFLASFSLSACGEKGATEEAGKESLKGAAKVQWNTSLVDALQTAQAQKKPVLVNCFANYCGWCKALDRKTLKDRRVKELLPKFIPVRLDVSKYVATASKYRVVGLPTVLFLDSRGNEVYRVIGFREAGDFVREMHTALRKMPGG
jgi:thiol:disulfide interchange protein DsbD